MDTVSNEIVRTRNPIELLTHKRFDVVVKYLYASHQKSEFYKDMYREHLHRWNNFTEKEPFKRGFKDFDIAFQNIINNFDKTPPIPVNPEGHIPNGAHRLATALYYQKPIKIRDAVEEELHPIVADYKRFYEKEYPRHMLERTAIEYAKLKSNTHVVCLFPIAHTKYWEVMDIICKYVNIFYASTEVFTDVGKLAFMKEIYFVEGWANEAGIQRKCNQCFRGEDRATFLLIDADNLETVKKMKAEIRALFNVGNHSVHISDFHEDAIRISKTIFNKNSIHFLNHRKNVSFPNYTKLMADMKPDDSKVISGSAVLSLYGLRDCRDIDLIYDSVKPPKDSHNQYIVDFGGRGASTYYGNLTLDDIVHNPLYHFHYQGFKYVSLEETKRMKKRRDESKDARDLKLIRQVL